jgi:polar amino acid transport system permease protein
VNFFQKKYHWHLLTLVILFVLVIGLGLATKKIDYTWNWNRVPQYFIYNHEINYTVTDDAQVTNIETNGSKTVVTVINEFNEEETFIVDSEHVNVSPDEDLFAGDTIGSTYKWMPGPLLKGVWTTLWISAVASVFGMIIGLAVGLCRIAQNITLRQLSIIYIELIRGTPLLVQIFIAYFFVGTVFNIDRIVAGIAALAIFAGAYVAEIIRAGIQSIPRGQAEAARSLGMNTTQSMIHIILPQAFKRTLPPLAGQFISLIKDSSLLSIIAITELSKSGREVITSTFATFEIWFLVALLYLIMTLSLSQVVAWIERRLAVSD